MPNTLETYLATTKISAVENARGRQFNAEFEAEWNTLYDIPQIKTFVIRRGLNILFAELENYQERQKVKPNLNAAAGLYSDAVDAVIARYENDARSAYVTKRLEGRSSEQSFEDARPSFDSGVVSTLRDCLSSNTRLLDNDPLSSALKREIIARLGNGTQTPKDTVEHGEAKLQPSTRYTPQ